MQTAAKTNRFFLRSLLAFWQFPDAGYTCLDNGTKYYRVRNANVYGDVYGVNGESNTVVVDASGTITISGNIAYKSITGGDNFSNLADLPQLLIFAEGINITGSVTRVDAWLLAGQKNDSTSTAYVNTCSDVSNDHFMFNSDQGASVCNLQLEINGPIFAKNLYLNRTAGAGTGVNSPSISFNPLRKSSILRALVFISECAKINLC